MQLPVAPSNPGPRLLATLPRQPRVSLSGPSGPSHPSSPSNRRGFADSRAVMVLAGAEKRSEIQEGTAEESAHLAEAPSGSAQSTEVTYRLYSLQTLGRSALGPSNCQDKLHRRAGGGCPMSDV